jgi:hypothetical protein
MTLHMLFPNEIRIHSQDVRIAGIAIADWVSAAHEGWLVIYRSPKFSSTEIVGCAPIRQGLNLGVKVAINLLLISNCHTLFAVLQPDNDASTYSSEAMIIEPVAIDQVPQMAA